MRQWPGTPRWPSTEARVAITSDWSTASASSRTAPRVRVPSAARRPDAPSCSRPKAVWKRAPASVFQRSRPRLQRSASVCSVAMCMDIWHRLRSAGSSTSGSSGGKKPSTTGRSRSRHSALSWRLTRASSVTLRPVSRPCASQMYRACSSLSPVRPSSSIKGGRPWRRTSACRPGESTYSLSRPVR